MTSEDNVPAEIGKRKCYLDSCAKGHHAKDCTNQGESDYHQQENDDIDRACSSHSYGSQTRTEPELLR